MVDLACVAQIWREAIDGVDLSDAPGFLSSFPEGCCGWGTRLVGYYLKAECHLNPVRVFGERDALDGHEEHEWIEVDGTVIDITADQFPTDGQPPVIVSTESQWHQEWSEIQRAEVDNIHCYDQNVVHSGRVASEIYEELAESVRCRCRT